MQLTRKAESLNVYARVRYAVTAVCNSQIDAKVGLDKRNGFGGREQGLDGSGKRLDSPNSLMPAFVNPTRLHQI